MYLWTSSAFEIRGSDPEEAPGVRPLRNLETNSCSGASTRYVAPRIVSGLVVKTSITWGSDPLAPLGVRPPSLNLIKAPSLLPIQFLWDSLIYSGQFKLSKSSSNRSAYFVIFNIH